jgi:non-ribosomal peptide synthetase component E (peptide arylation enzyme)
VIANLVEIYRHVSRQKADHPALVWRDRSWTYAELEERFHRFARGLARRGLGCRRERAELEPCASGQDALAL